MATTQGYPFNDQPAPPRKTGCGCFPSFGVGCAVMLLLCCGGIGGIGWWVVTTLEAGFSEDPVVVAKVASEIAGVTPPEGFKPVASLKVEIPLLGYFRMAAFDEEDVPLSTLILMQLPAVMSGDPDRALSEAEKQMQRQGRKKNEDNFRVMESKTEDLNVRGKPAAFTFAKGHYVSKPKETYWRVMGVFQGQDGMGMLVLTVPVDDWTDEELKDFVRSIK
jgi:hypothetical protein